MDYIKKRWSEIKGNEETGLFRVRKENTDFYSLLLPIPLHRELYASRQNKNKSAFCIELYFTDEVLGSLNSLDEEMIAGVSEKRKFFKGSKSTFWKKLFELPFEEFIYFKPLFNKIEDLFNINNSENDKNVKLD